MKTILTIILTFLFAWTFSQTETEAIELCEKFIQKKKSTTENKKVDGQKTGYWSHYYDSSDELTNNPESATSISIVNYEADIPKGICVECYTNSKLFGFGTYLEDTTWTEDGIFKSYDKNGTVYMEETYVNGGLHGITKENYKNGKLRFELFYVNDTLTKMNNYEKDGALIGTKEYSYTPDTVVVLNLYRDDGSRIIHQRQVNGKDDGDYFIYYKDGGIKLESKNVKGIRIFEKVYDKKGNLKKESTCNNDGSKSKMIFYSKDGKIKKKVTGGYPGTKYKPIF